MERDTGIKHHVDAINRGGRHFARSWRRSIRDIIEYPTLPMILAAGLAVIAISAEVPSCNNRLFEDNRISASDQVVDPHVIKILGFEFDKGRDLLIVPSGS